MFKGSEGDKHRDSRLAALHKQPLVILWFCFFFLNDSLLPHVLHTLLFSLVIFIFALNMLKQRKATNV